MDVFVLLAGCAVGVIATLVAVKVLESRRASPTLGGEHASQAAGLN